jgi:hypothetical protein
MIDAKELAKGIVQGLVPYLVGNRNETKGLNETLKAILEESKKKEQYEVEISDSLKEELKGKDGSTPIKGVDYFTDEEIQNLVELIKEAVTPILGVDYFTEEDEQALIEKVKASIEAPKNGKPGKNGKTPKKGEDYFTEDDIKTIAEVVVDLVLEQLPEPKLPNGKELLKILRKLPKENGLQIKDVYGLQKALEAVATAAGSRRVGGGGSSQSGGSVVPVIINVTDPIYNISQVEGEIHLLCDSTLNAITLNFPTAISNTAKYIISRLNAGGNLITLQPFGAQTLNGEVNKTIRYQNTSVTIVSTGVNLRII